jgi:hypothetical protein
MVQINGKTLKFIHSLIWILWALLTISYNGEKTKNAYNLFFGRYLSYDFFHWSELIFMFGGGLLLLALLVKLLPDKFTYLGYVVFELLFISIIVIKLFTFLYQ